MKSIDSAELIDSLYTKFSGSDWEAAQNKLVLQRYIRMVEYMKARSGKRKSILDFGCGVGQNAFILSQYGFDVHGLELYSHHDWPSPRISLTVYNGKNMPYKNDSFDMLVMFGVLEHVGPERRNPSPEGYTKTQTFRHKLLKEIHRVLKPNGQLYIWNFPHIHSPIEMIGELLKLYRHEVYEKHTLSELKNLISVSGFVIQESGRTGVLPAALGHHSKIIRQHSNLLVKPFNTLDQITDSLVGNYLGQSNFVFAEKILLDE